MLWNWAVGSGWRDFKKHDRKSLYCPEQTGSRTMVFRNLLVRDEKEVRSAAEKTILSSRISKSSKTECQ